MRYIAELFTDAKGPTLMSMVIIATTDNGALQIAKEKLSPFMPFTHTIRLSREVEVVTIEI